MWENWKGSLGFMSAEVWTSILVNQVEVNIRAIFSYFLLSRNLLLSWIPSEFDVHTLRAAKFQASSWTKFINIESCWKSKQIDNAKNLCYRERIDKKYQRIFLEIAMLRRAGPNFCLFLTGRLHFINIYWLQFFDGCFWKRRQIMPKSHACEEK